MAITTIGSYITTLDEFIAHWQSVNAALGGSPATDLTLHGGYARAAMIAGRAELQDAITDLEGKENDRQIAASARDITKDELRDRLASFRGMLQGKLPGTPYLAAMPRLPQPGAAESKFLAPLDDMANLWDKVNNDATTAGFTPPLLLAGGYDLATFLTELAGLRAMYAAVTLAENEQRVARKQRDAMLPPLRARMVQYRTLVEATFGETHPLTLSLPTLTPQPGSTPEAVVLSGYWDDVAIQAVLSWTASTNPALQVYELRGCIGPDYDEETSEFIANFGPGTLSTPTLFGLIGPGDTVTFKVFVHLTTGNQAGSNPVTITRM